MKLDQVEKIIAMFERTSLDSMDLEIEDIKIKLTKSNEIRVVTSNQVASSAKQEETNAPLVDNKEYINSPIVGAFHAAQFQGADPFVHVGDSVKQGQKLCIIEAMKVMNEINAPRDGVITEILVNENDMVEFGTKLFVIE